MKVAPGINQRRNSRGFSLVEALVCAAILAAVIAASVPWLRAKGDARLTAREVISAQIVRARSLAISRGTDTVLLFAGYDPPLAGAGGKRLAVVIPGDDEEPWIPLDRWESLPGDIAMFDQEAAECSRTTLYDIQERMMFHYQGHRISGPYLRFDRRGVMVHPPRGEPADLVFGPGRVTAGGVVSTRRTPDGTPVLERLRVGRINGRIQSIEAGNP